MARVRLTQAIEASTATLWGYLTTSTGLSCWQADLVEGGLESGSFSLRWPSLGVRLDLSVSEVSVGEFIVLRAGQNQLTLSLEGSGVALDHEGLDELDDLEGLESSWRLALNLLRHAAERHPEKPRQVRWSFCPVSASHELIHYYFSTPAGLRCWLGSWLGDVDAQSANGSLRAGVPYHLSSERFELRGHVLVNDAGRDVALSVAELGQGVLVLRTLPAAEGRVVALGVSTWEQENGARELVAQLEACLPRLATALKDRGVC